MVHCQQSGIIRRCFQNIIYHFYSNRPNIQLKLSPLVQDLFYELHALSTGEQTERVEDELVKQVIYRLRTSPQSDTLGRLAEDFGVSESTLSNRFKRATGSTLYRYQLETKLEMARSLLLSGESAPLDEIARLYGLRPLPFQQAVPKAVWNYPGGPPQTAEGGEGGVLPSAPLEDRGGDVLVSRRETVQGIYILFTGSSIYIPGNAGKIKA